MSEILGHDIDGRPLRVGDEVVVVEVTSLSWTGMQGIVLTVSGIEPDNGWMLRFEELDDDFVSNPRRLRKLHNDHRPADESFTEMMDKFKGVRV